jgi:hypothetical protein
MLTLSKIDAVKTIRPQGSGKDTKGQVITLSFSVALAFQLPGGLKLFQNPIWQYSIDIKACI